MTSPGTSNVVVVVPGNDEAEVPRRKIFPRENEARGATQTVIAMIHIALGGILLFASKEFSPLTMSVWYPFWGAGLFFISGYFASKAAKKPVECLTTASHIFNFFSGFGALAGIGFMIFDLVEMFKLHQIFTPYWTSYYNGLRLSPKYIVPLLSDGITSADNHRSIKAYERGIMFVMLIFSFLQCLTAFQTLALRKEKDKSRRDNTEQNIALLTLTQTGNGSRDPPPSPPPPPPYFITGTNKYAEFPGTFL